MRRELRRLGRNWGSRGEPGPAATPAPGSLGRARGGAPGAGGPGGNPPAPPPSPCPLGGVGDAGGFRGFPLKSLRLSCGFILGQGAGGRLIINFIFWSIFPPSAAQSAVGSCFVVTTLNNASEVQAAPRRGLLGPRAGAGTVLGAVPGGGPHEASLRPGTRPARPSPS